MTTNEGDMEKNYELTSEQRKAFAALSMAFKRCQEANVYVWDSYGTISAGNGNVIRAVSPDESLDAPLDEYQVETISRVHINSNADDGLFVTFQ